jgi:hypothetical protein
MYYRTSHENVSDCGWDTVNYVEQLFNRRHYSDSGLLIMFDALT